MKSNRRLYLSLSLKVLLLIAVGLASIPFLLSLQAPGEGEPGELNPWLVEAELDGIIPGSYQAIAWPGGEVWVYRRSQADLDYLYSGQDVQPGEPGPMAGQPLLTFDKRSRSFLPEYFVFLPKESIRGCQVYQQRLASGQNGFAERCYGAHYDIAGRKIKHSGRAEQQYLTVPPHEFLSATRMRMLRRHEGIE